MPRQPGSPARFMAEGAEATSQKGPTNDAAQKPVNEAVVGSAKVGKRWRHARRDNELFMSLRRQKATKGRGLAQLRRNITLAHSSAAINKYVTNQAWVAIDQAL